jgi:HEAT repeat protein
MLAPRLLLPLFIGLAAAAPSPAAAQNKPAAGKKTLNLERLRSELESGVEQRILQALRQVEQAGSEGALALPLVEALVKRGASVPVCLQALTVVASFRRPSSSESIAPYVRHRSAEVRRAAARALSETGGPVAVSALRGALRSSDASVRAMAAEGLGKLGDASAVPDLLVALERGVAEAAPSIGRLCAVEQCTQFVGGLDKLEMGVMLSGLKELLPRPAVHIPDDFKIQLIGRMAAKKHEQLDKFLRELLERGLPNASLRVKQALEQALQTKKP